MVRNGRRKHIIVYTESFGTILIATHYHKFCPNFRKGYVFRQYYKYSLWSITMMNAWSMNDYFVQYIKQKLQLSVSKWKTIESIINTRTLKKHCALVLRTEVQQTHKL